MQTSKDQISVQENESPTVNPGNYSLVTVYMKDSLGAIFLGILTVILLIEWTRAEARCRILLTQLEATYGNHSPNAR